MSDMMGELWMELLVPPEWPRVEAVRQATDLAVRSVSRFAPEELATSLAIVAGELMENAVKYGRADRPVSFGVRREPGRVVIEVSNDIDLEHTSPKVLKDRVDWLASFESPLAAFHASIAGLDSGSEVDGAGLGLARIMHEGECRLACALEDGTITIEAWRPWPDPKNGDDSPSGSSGAHGDEAQAPVAP